MRVLTLLDQIRSRWASSVAEQLARGEEVRQSFDAQLNRYFDLMQQAIVSGDPAWLNEILDEWIFSGTQSERSQKDISIAPILGKILLTLHIVASDRLASDDALLLIGAVLPLHTHAIQYASRKEADVHIEFISTELEKAHQALARLDKSKSDFIAVAAHELKTPLTLIDGYTAMLADQFPKDESAQQQGAVLLDGVNNGIRRLQDIINDMIDVSLIDNDLLQLNFQPVWLNQLLKVAGQELAAVLAERSLTLKIEAFPGHDEMTFADPERVFQALWNILANAVKYTPDNGSITVSGRKLPGFIEVTVADTGIGIAPENHEQVFEKFGRLGNTALHSSGKTKFKGGGPGLGLPITKGIIDAHGGAIWVESEGYDEQACPGATFHILLPQRTESPDEKMTKLFEQIQTAASSVDMSNTTN